MPVEVRNLPPHVRVLDVGLNGVLITEDESRRSFTMEALPARRTGRADDLRFRGRWRRGRAADRRCAAAEGIRFRVKAKSSPGRGN